MARTMYIITIVSLVLLGLLLADTWRLAHADAGQHKMINLSQEGPRPQTLKVAVGTPVVWLSHLADTQLEVVTIAFLDGSRVSQVTSPVAGYNGFTLEGGHFVGRMEGDGGKVALQFSTPGEYTYTIDHREHLTGTIVVQP